MGLFSSNRRQEQLGMTLAFGSLLLSGTYNAFAKGLTPYLSPMSLLIVSEALTAFFIVVTFGLVPLLKKFMELDGKTLRVAVIVGLFNSAVGPLLWFTGLARTSAANASILSSADVICVLLFGALLLREPITKVQGIGALVILSGVAIINVSSFSEPLGMHMGDLFILCGAIVFGLGEVLFKKYLSHIMPELALVIRNIIGISAVLILSLTFRYSFGGEMASFPVSKIMLLVAFAFFARYLNLTFYYEAMDRLPSTTLSMVSIATPLTGLLFAVVILGEQLQPAHVLGGLVIVFGLLIEQSSSRAVRALRQRWSLAHIPFLRKHQDDRPVFFPGHA